jgi:para-aminobenzoate synthetase component 1
MLFSIPLAESDLPALLAELSVRTGFFILGDPAGPVRESNRWIFFGAEPRELLAAKGRRCVWHHGETDAEEVEDSPMELLAAWLTGRRVQRPSARRRPFLSGWVGWLGHDLAWHAEPHLGRHLAPPRAVDDLNQPDLLLGLYHTVWAWDRAARRLSVFVDDDLTPEPVAQCRRTCEELVRRAVAEAAAPGPFELSAEMAMPNISRRDYTKAIERIHEYILAGDVYEVNFTLRFSCPFHGDALGLWWSLVHRHPMPWSALLEARGAWLVGNSPECLLTLTDDRLVTCPIKGTAPRGETPSQDALFASELLRSEKDHAEHLMIVDLERNDLGRVAIPGSVQVREFARLDTHPTLHHLVSTIEAVRRPEATTADVLRALLPGGSVTGAPKARAIEIIDELEPVRRGPFFGAVGWIDRSGDAALALAIRTGLVRGTRFDLAVGGAIVADSEAVAERTEARLKAAAFLGAPNPEATGP